VLYIVIRNAEATLVKIKSHLLHPPHFHWLSLVKCIIEPVIITTRFVYPKVN